MCDLTDSDIESDAESVFSGEFTKQEQDALRIIDREEEHNGRFFPPTPGVDSNVRPDFDQKWNHHHQQQVNSPIFSSTSNQQDVATFDNNESSSSTFPVRLSTEEKLLQTKRDLVSPPVLSPAPNHQKRIRRLSRVEMGELQDQVADVVRNSTKELVLKTLRKMTDRLAPIDRATALKYGQREAGRLKKTALATAIRIYFTSQNNNNNTTPATSPSSRAASIKRKRVDSPSRGEEDKEKRRKKTGKEKE